MFGPEDRAPDVEPAQRPWHRLQPADLSAVFPSPLKPGTPRRIRTIQRLVATSLTAAPIAALEAPHVLRQTVATSLLNAGASVAVVKARMGHRSCHLTRRDPQLDAASTRRAEGVEGRAVCAGVGRSGQRVGTRGMVAKRLSTSLRFMPAPFQAQARPDAERGLRGTINCAYMNASPQNRSQHSCDRFGVPGAFSGKCTVSASAQNVNL